MVRESIQLLDTTILLCTSFKYLENLDIWQHFGSRGGRDFKFYNMKFQSSWLLSCIFYFLILIILYCIYGYEKYFCCHLLCLRNWDCNISGNVETL